MKISFVIPPEIHFIEPYAFTKVVKSNAERPALGILYVAAALMRDKDIKPDIVDCCVDELSLEDLGDMMARSRPDIVGFSVLTFNLLNCLDAARVIRERSPETTIIFGGWHPTLYPAETLALDEVDYIVIGEGERTICELVSALEAPADTREARLAEVDGIGFKKAGGEVVVTKARGLIMDLDELPPPAYELVDETKYSNIMAETSRLVNLMTSRGCPQRCVFCDMRRSKFRKRSAENILAEIADWYDKGVREFYLQDDNFTISRKRALEFCRLVTESNMRFKYKISSRVDYLDDELLAALAASGCYRIHFGVESGSPHMLEYLQKGITPEKIKNAFALSRKHGIDRFAYIMIGIPGETDEDVAMTRALVREIQPDHLHCSICTPMPKTYLYERMLEEGLIEHDYWLDFARKPDPQFVTPFASERLGHDELRTLQNTIQRDFYMSPRIIWREIKKTKGIRPFLKKAALAVKIFKT